MACPPLVTFAIIHDTVSGGDGDGTIIPGAPLVPVYSVAMNQTFCAKLG